MSKIKTIFVCQNCGAKSAKWIGKCASCMEWNTYIEEIEKKEDSLSAISSLTSSQALLLQDIEQIHRKRILFGDLELDRVLGGGLVQGAVILVAGEPGIGKSTLLLQNALRLSQKKILYVSGEESEEQIKMRADRLEISHANCWILAESNLSEILLQVNALQPDLIVIDSIQTLYSPSIESGTGSISQIRECTSLLTRYAKSSGCPVILVGHITKEGQIAGPKVLEHMVDTVLYFEGDRHLTFRILRANKNRFGSTSEIGLYQMDHQGLQQVSNPSEILLSGSHSPRSGTAISATIEGNRTLLIETQSLVSPATFGTPQRSTTGFENKRLNMILAVLEKRIGLRLSQQDVFLNLAGGLRIEDPALDLAVSSAIISSYYDKILPLHTCFAAEIGLGGEVRGINKIESRIAEADRLGFKNMVLSVVNKKSLQAPKSMKLTFVDSVAQLINLIEI